MLNFTLRGSSIEFLGLQNQYRIWFSFEYSVICTANLLYVWNTSEIKCTYLKKLKPCTILKISKTFWKITPCLPRRSKKSFIAEKSLNPSVFLHQGSNFLHDNKFKIYMYRFARPTLKIYSSKNVSRITQVELLFTLSFEDKHKFSLIGHFLLA